MGGCTDEDRSNCDCSIYYMSSSNSEKATQCKYMVYFNSFILLLFRSLEYSVCALPSVGLEVNDGGYYAADTV